MDELDNLITTLKKVRELDGWAKDKGMEGFAKEIPKEADEVIGAVVNKDIDNLREEIGDVIGDCLMTIMFAEQDALFSLREVLIEYHEKIKRRKPYLDDGKELSKEEVLKIWHRIKEEEKKDKENKDGVG